MPALPIRTVSLGREHAELVAVRVGEDRPRDIPLPDVGPPGPASGVDSAVSRYAPVPRRLYRYHLPYPLDYLRESNREHAALVAALERGGAVEAVRVARAHVEVLHRTMFAGLIR